MEIVRQTASRSNSMWPVLREGSGAHALVGRLAISHLRRRRFANARQSLSSNESVGSNNALSPTNRIHIAEFARALCWCKALPKTGLA